MAKRIEPLNCYADKYNGKTLADMCPSCREILALRRMLAVACCGHLLYGDDGELSSTTENPFIDFRRDSPEEIERKLGERAQKKLSGSTNPAKA